MPSKTKSSGSGECKNLLHEGAPILGEIAGMVPGIVVADVAGLAVTVAISSNLRHQPAPEPMARG